MITCKQVANALARKNYESLSPVSKFGLRLHVKLCFWCGDFHREVMKHQDFARAYSQREQFAKGRSSIKVPNQMKDRWKQALR